MLLYAIGISWFGPHHRNSLPMPGRHGLVWQSLQEGQRVAELVDDRSKIAVSLPVAKGLNGDVMTARPTLGRRLHLLWYASTFSAMSLTSRSAHSVSSTRPNHCNRKTTMMRQMQSWNHHETNASARPTPGWRRYKGRRGSGEASAACGLFEGRGTRSAER